MWGKWFENFDFPIVGSKIKIVVNLSVTYQNLSGEKYKTNGKRISSIRLYLVREKSKIPSENTIFAESGIFFPITTRAIQLESHIDAFLCDFLLKKRIYQDTHAFMFAKTI